MKEFTNEDDVTIEIGLSKKEVCELMDIIDQNDTYSFTASTVTGREFRVVLMSDDELEQRKK